MCNQSNIIGALLVISALAGGNALAGDKAPPVEKAPAIDNPPAAKPAVELEYELHTGYTNEYLFRGLNLGHDLVEVGGDIRAGLHGFGLSLGAWFGSFNDADFEGANDLNVTELDLYGQVARNFGWVTGSVGYIYRHYDSDEDLTLENQEVYFSLSHEFYGVDASLTYFLGVEGDNDGYSEFGLSRSFDINPSVAVNCGTKLGYLVEQGQLTAFTTQLSLDWGFTAHARLSPFVKWSIALSDDPDTAYEGSKNQLVGGMMLSVGF